MHWIIKLVSLIICHSPYLVNTHPYPWIVGGKPVEKRCSPNNPYVCDDKDRRNLSDCYHRLHTTSLNFSSTVTDSNGQNISSNFSLMHVHYDTNGTLTKRSNTGYTYERPKPVQCPNNWRTSSASCRRDRSPQAYSISCLNSYSQIDATIQAIILQGSCNFNEICVTSGSNAYCSDTTMYLEMQRLLNTPGVTAAQTISIDYSHPLTTADGPITANTVITDMSKTQTLVAKRIAFEWLMMAKNHQGPYVRTCDECSSLEMVLPLDTFRVHTAASLDTPQSARSGSGLIWLATFST